MISKILSFFLALITTLTSFPIRSISDRAKNFRITAYVVGNTFADASKVDDSHFEDITDVILISVANFNDKGEIILSDNFETVLSNLKSAMEGSGANLYLNFIGPGCRIKSDDWYEQMEDQSKYHNLAFESGVLEKNIKDTLDKYGFDGVFFDYEYPVTKADRKAFDKFLLSLDAYIGDEYKIGSAVSPWNNCQTRASVKAVDFVEVMAYDIWENDGTHSSLRNAKQCIRQMLLNGYKKEQLDLGVPFYARPTNHGAYWYGYNGYYEKLDEKGFCVDDETGLTFSFNTYDMVYEKTQWAINKGLGGMMVWHYACDVPESNPQSLFNAMANAKNDMIK